MKEKYPEIDTLKLAMKLALWKLKHLAAAAKCSIPTASRYMRKHYSMPQGRKIRVSIAINEAIQERLTVMLRNKEYTK